MQKGKGHGSNGGRASSAGCDLFPTPFLPYLLKAGRKAGEAAIEEFGKDSWERAKLLWARLDAKPVAKKPVEDYATALLKAQQELSEQLAQHIAADEALGTALEQTLPSTVITSTVRVRKVLAGGEVTGVDMDVAEGRDVTSIVEGGDVSGKVTGVNLRHGG